MVLYKCSHLYVSEAFEPDCLNKVTQSLMLGEQSPLFLEGTILHVKPFSST